MRTWMTRQLISLGRILDSPQVEPGASEAADEDVRQ